MQKHFIIVQRNKHTWQASTTANFVINFSFYYRARSGSNIRGVIGKTNNRYRISHALSLTGVVLRPALHGKFQSHPRCRNSSIAPDKAGFILSSPFAANLEKHRVAAVGVNGGDAEIHTRPYLHAVRKVLSNLWFARGVPACSRRFFGWNGTDGRWMWEDISNTHIYGRTSVNVLYFQR